MNNKEENLFERVMQVQKAIASDDMGGSSLDKCFVMAYLAQRFALKSYVEIGVYRGKSLFSVAPAFQENHGSCIGIDPWFSDNFREQDATEVIKKLIDDFTDTADFDMLYHEALMKKVELNLGDTVTIIRKTSEEAFPLLVEQFDREEDASASENHSGRTFIDMLHIDGNHDYVYVSKDAELYVPLVNQGGFVVFDDIDWDSVRRVYERYKEKLIPIYETDTFGILLREDSLKELPLDGKYCPTRFAPYGILRTLLPAVAENVRAQQSASSGEKKARVYVAIMAYNQGQFIEEAIASLLAQHGDNFTLTIGVFDDCSTDDTLALAESFHHLPENMQINLHPNERNGGFERNYIRIFDAFLESGCDYLTILDGDDYFASPDRIAAHLDGLSRHPECAVSFNRLMYYYEDSREFSLWDDQDKLEKQVYTAFDLAKDYFIGNGSCSMIRRNAVMGISNDFYLEAKIGDWLSHCLYATRGDILYIPEIMNIYRKHKGGVWSCVTEKKRYHSLMSMLRKFNTLSGYMFYGETYDTLVEIRRSLLEDITSQDDLLIIDDIFPHPVSGFRMEEYGEYLKHFQRMKILCNGGSTTAVGKAPHSEIMGRYLHENPAWREKLLEDHHIYIRPFAKNSRVHARLAYFCFLGNAYTYLQLMEQSKTPFVFELYPGGSFALDSPKSDEMLLRVLRSPCFRKVIVTQDVTRDYLLNNNFCSADQIEEIFGVVTPARLLQTKPVINQNGPLRICFAAMRYTKDGRDKGYDVFLDTVRILNRRNLDIEVHVAGRFDEDVIPLEELEGKITFHGVLNNDALSAFFQGMDIIVSPNINNIIGKGTFDGFPTGTCTEAGLNGVLIMCTDPLLLNHGRFLNQEEIEIVPHDAAVIADRIAYYCNHRDALARVIEHQYQKIQKLYGTDTQVGKRIRILESEIASYEENCAFIEEFQKTIKIVRCRMFYSDVSDHFDLEDSIDFEVQVSDDGKAHGDIIIEQIRGCGKYIWIYFMPDTAFLMQHCALVSRDMVHLPVSCNRMTRQGACLFDDAESNTTFGKMSEMELSEKIIRFEGTMTPIEDIPKWEEQIERYTSLPQCCAYVYCSEYADRFNSDECLAATARYDFDHAFKISIPLNAELNDQYFWIYLKATSPSYLRINHLLMDSNALTPLIVEGETEHGLYVSEDRDSMMYLGKLSDISAGSMLCIDAYASPQNHQKG